MDTEGLHWIEKTLCFLTSDLDSEKLALILLLATLIYWSLATTDYCIDPCKLYQELCELKAE